MNASLVQTLIFFTSRQSGIEMFMTESLVKMQCFSDKTKQLAAEQDGKLRKHFYKRQKTLQIITK